MEYFWLVTAALLAGVGTGLAGLSAATVMVPMMFVLCPGFAGETGAYQATAIALASDILGSAVTAATYAKNKNIDLKRGGVMLACIIAMCTAGSYAAWLAGNVVLGSFTLFLTFCIGIRFLVKPDTTREDTAAKGEKLDTKGVIISLFFGLTIGFGTGFVGSGGGMMMLVVFTAFLGMELKTAVGTSTFIMTFTALIASVSHIIIHPAIVLEKWPELIIAMTVATAASLYSARFANRVSNRTVGLVTGVVLTLLGASMITLKFWDTLSGITLFYDSLICLRNLITYLIPCVVMLVLVRLIFRHLPGFVFRKVLHFVAFSCITEMVLTAASWQSASLVSVLFAALVYPILSAAESLKGFGSFFLQKSPGEVKRSLIKLFVMFAAVIAVSWGIFGEPVIAASSLLMWGVGDAAAALIGTPFGKHKVKWKITDGKKSWEGTAAMFVSAFVCGLAVMDIASWTPGAGRIPACLAAAAAGAFTELISGSEWDTVTVPAAIMTVLHIVSVSL